MKSLVFKQRRRNFAGPLIGHCPQGVSAVGIEDAVQMVTLVLDYDRGESFYRIAVSIKRFPIHIRQNQRAVAAHFVNYGGMLLKFSIIESIPSKKAEPIKVWMAAIVAERINQAIDYIKSLEELPFPKPDEQ